MSENTQPNSEQVETQTIVLAGTRTASSNAIALMAGDIFKGIDFTGLNNAITSIAGKAGELDDKEKQAAISIVSDWENQVKARLRDKKSEMDNFLSFFNVGASGDAYNDMLDDLGIALSVKTNTQNEYDAYMAVRDEIHDFQQTRPEEPYFDGNTTPIMKIKLQADYDKKKVVYDNQLAKLKRKERLAEQAWKKLLKEHADVKELTKQARHFNKNMSKFQDECHEKGQLAKLNINIQSDTVRDALRELLDFTHKI